MFDYAEGLRLALAERSDRPPKFGWYFRMDPQIAEVYGRADYAMTAFPDRIATLKARGDHFGVHVHPVRWCVQRHLWVHEFADAQYIEHCLISSFDAFSRWAGYPARRFRAGAGFLSNDMIATLEKQGVTVDLSLEPVAGWGLSSNYVATGIDHSPMVGPYLDCRNAPRVPYRPAHDNFLMKAVDGGQGHNLVMVPHTTYPLGHETSSWRGRARRLLNLVSPRWQVAYPTLLWPSPKFYWDLLEHQLQSMTRPYLSLGIRTDAPDSAIMGQVRRIFDALPEHRLAGRLRFVDPLDAAPDLL